MSISKYLTIFLSFCLVLVASCDKSVHINYLPVGTNVEDPVSIIKETLESQPKAQRYKPAAVEVSEKHITLYKIESGGVGIGWAGRIVAVPQGDRIKPSVINYKHIGDVKLFWDEKYDQWYVQISDMDNNLFCYVFTYSKLEAQRFIDAVSYMISQSK